MAVGAARNLATRVAAGTVSPVDVTVAALARIDELDGELCAFTKVDRGGAMAAALRVAERVSEGERLPMAGVPVALKGRQSLGAPWARRLRDAGAVVIGWTSGMVPVSVDDVRLFVEVASGRDDPRLPPLPLRAAADRLADEGVIEWVDAPVSLEPLWDAWDALHDLEGALADGKPLPDGFRTPLPEAIAGRARQDARLAEVFTTVDVILTPTSAGVAHLIADPDPPVRLVELTAWVNVAGSPAISLPAGLTRGGLPVGLQIVAPNHEDASCLAIAVAWEASRAAAEAPEPIQRTGSGGGR